MIGIIDYGMGNLRSVQKALQAVGAEAEILTHAEEVNGCEKVILPGVGAFDDAARHLVGSGMVEPVKEFIATGKPFLGICLGLALLFEASEEGGQEPGLGVFKGKSIRFRPEDETLTVPHMGWNALKFEPNDKLALYQGLEPGCHVYFVHSYYCEPVNESIVATWTDYGGDFCSSVQQDNVMACQFHPEKSQAVGLKMLENFSKL